MNYNERYTFRHVVDGVHCLLCFIHLKWLCYEIFILYNFFLQNSCGWSWAVEDKESNTFLPLCICLSVKFDIFYLPFLLLIHSTPLLLFFAHLHSYFYFQKCLYLPQLRSHMASSLVSTKHGDIKSAFLHEGENSAIKPLHAAQVYVVTSF